MAMNIYAEPGTLVIYENVSAGFDADQEEAREYLVPNTIYTVAHVEVGDWMSRVYLEEAPEIGFNTVLFNDVE